MLKGREGGNDIRWTEVGRTLARQGLVLGWGVGLFVLRVVGSLSWRVVSRCMTSSD